MTQGQIERTAKLRGDHRVLQEREGSPTVERSGGRPTCEQAGELASARPAISPAQSYLDIERC